MYRLRQRIADKGVLKLIGKYLRAGVRMKDGSTEKTLKGVPQGGPLSPLLVNQDKSKVARLRACDFLGFKIRGKQLHGTDKSARGFKHRIQEMTTRSRGISMKQRLPELKHYCVGWFDYFKIGLPYKEVREWDAWIRRRVRLCYWKDWKVPRKRRGMLIKLGISLSEVKKASRSRKGYWRMSRNSLVSIALNNTYLSKQGVPCLRELWISFKYAEKAKA